MPQSQTAVVLHQKNLGKPLENIKVVSDAPIPDPAAEEVLVRVHLRPVNPTDIITLSGFGAGQQTLPRVPGSEGVGTVKSQSKKFQKGTRVVGVPFPRQKEYGGSWQQFVAIPEADLVRR